MLLGVAVLETRKGEKSATQPYPLLAVGAPDTLEGQGIG